MHFCWLLEGTGEEALAAEHQGLISVCARDVVPRSLTAAHNKRLLQRCGNPIVGMFKATAEFMLKQLLGMGASPDHRGRRYAARSQHIQHMVDDPSVRSPGNAG